MVTLKKRRAKKSELLTQIFKKHGGVNIDSPLLHSRSNFDPKVN